MSNKYKDMISKIEASEEFKNRVIDKMQKEQIKKCNTLMMKFRKIITTWVSLLGIAACSGLVYATVSGKIRLGVQDIVFSEEYTKYEQKVEGQYLENEKVKLELISTMCDEGFLVLQFNLDVKEDINGIEYVSFNDELIEENDYVYLDLNGANYNLIIDGEEYWLKGAVDSQIIENKKDKNYTVYQLYFLPSDIVNDKEEFSITLENVVVVSDQDHSGYIEMDGKFEINISKEKVLKDTKVFMNEKSSIKYERLTNKIEKVSQTPMQTIIKITSLTEDITIRNTTNLVAEDYIGDLIYKVYDQNDIELFSYSMISEYTLYSNDGTEEKISINDFDLSTINNNHNKELKNEYIVTEKDEEIKSLRVEVYEYNDYFERLRHIGTHNIDLNNEKVISENKNDIIEENVDIIVPDTILIEDIEYFDIEINEEYDMYCNYVDFKKVFYDNGDCGLEYNYDADKNNYKMIEYDIELYSAPDKVFSVILFKNRETFNEYSEDLYKWYNRSIIIIEENEENILAIDLKIEDLELEEIQYIVDTIKLK